MSQRLEHVEGLKAIITAKQRLAGCWAELTDGLGTVTTALGAGDNPAFEAAAPYSVILRLASGVSRLW